MRQRQQGQDILGTLEDRSLAADDSDWVRQAAKQPLLVVIGRRSQQVLDSGQLQPALRELKGAHQPLLRDRMRQQAVDPTRPQDHLAGVRLLETRDDIEERTLP